MPISNRPEVAVIADAGLGTRFLPITKVVPKGLLPVGDAPGILWLLRELRQVGINNVILVVNKRSLSIYQEFFAKDKKLEETLKAAGKLYLLDEFLSLLQNIKIELIEQPENIMYGTGAPLKASKSLLKGVDSFIYMFADDIVLGEPVLPLMIEAGNWLKLNDTRSIYGIVAVYPVPKEEVVKYGIISPVETKIMNSNEKTFIFDYIVEKPPVDKAPSNLASYGRYWFATEILEALNYSESTKNSLKEYYIQPAMSTLAASGIMAAVANPTNSYWVTTGDPAKMAFAWCKWRELKTEKFS